MPGADSGSFGAVDAGAIPAVAAFEGADAAFASGAPLDCSPEGWPVFLGSPGLGRFAFAGYHDRAHAEVVQGVIDTFLAVAAVGGDGAWRARGSCLDPRDRRRQLRGVGKGRKQRRTPLVPTTKAVLKAWLGERPGAPGDPLFPTTTGKRFSRDAIERRLAHRVALATASCPSLKAKHITMHTLRHTAAMRLLLAGNDVTVIALWLGHEQVSTTNVYLHADMTHKQQAIDRTKPLAAKPGRYRPPDPLLAFLEAL